MRKWQMTTNGGVPWAAQVGHSHGQKGTLNWLPLKHSECTKPAEGGHRPQSCLRKVQKAQEYKSAAAHTRLSTTGRCLTQE